MRNVLLQRGYPIQMICRGPSRSLPWQRGVCSLLLAWLLPGTGLAQDHRETGGRDEAWTLKPYSTVYKTTARGLSMKLRRELKVGEDGQCELTSEGSLLVVGLSETSHFRISDGRVTPASYIYQGSGLINRRREVHFSPDTPIIRSLYKGEWYSLPEVGHTLDRMSQQEQMRLNLLAQDEAMQEMKFKVADGRRVRNYTLTLLGQERLQTPVGEIDTLLYKHQRQDSERLSQLWIAPDWDYLAVKILHIEDGKTIEAHLISAEINGQPVEDYPARSADTASQVSYQALGSVTPR